MRTRAFYVGALVALLLSSGCAAARDDAKTMVKLHVFVQPFLSHAPLLVADAEGYFAEQGIEVEFVRLNDPATAIPMLVNGTIDVLPSGPTPGVLNAMARGLPVRAVADKGYIRKGDCNRGGIAVRKALLDEAKGGMPRIRRISIDKQPHQQYTVETMLASKGIKVEDLEAVYIPHLPESAALEDGSIDAALTGDPYVRPLLEKGIVGMWVSLEDVLPDAQFSFVYFGPNLLEKDPDTGRRFLVAYLKAVRQLEEGKTEKNLAVLARVTEEGTEMLQQMCWPAYHRDGRIDFRGVKDFQDWALRKGFIERAVTETEFWDPRFLEYANGVLANQKQ